MAAYALGHEAFPFHYKERLQQLFRLAALLPSLRDALIPCWPPVGLRQDHILPSLRDALIPTDGITLSGDGTCVHSHASPYGHNACKCRESGITACSCKRHFSDPDARWRWDSDKNAFYFGHTLYMLCSHNAGIGVDLHIRFLDASRHDSVSAIASLHEFRSINPDIPVRDLRLYTPVPRRTDEYKKIYNNRTSCERVNNRGLNGYHLHGMGIHTRNAIPSSPWSSASISIGMPV